MKYLLNLNTREIIPFYLGARENPHEFYGNSTMEVTLDVVDEIAKAKTDDEKDTIIKRLVKDRFMNAESKATLSEAEQAVIRKVLNDAQTPSPKNVVKAEASSIDMNTKIKVEDTLLTKEQILRLRQSDLVSYCRDVLKWKDVDDREPSTILRTRIIEAEGYKK